MDDNYYRPFHPLIGPFLREYLSGFEILNDDDDEMAHLYVSTSPVLKFSTTTTMKWDTYMSRRTTQGLWHGTWWNNGNYLHLCLVQHQEITRVILCRLVYIIMSFKPFNDIIMIVYKFLIRLYCLRSYST